MDCFSSRPNFTANTQIPEFQLHLCKPRPWNTAFLKKRNIGSYCWESNACPLGEQQVLLTTETYLKEKKKELSDDQIAALPSLSVAPHHPQENVHPLKVVVTHCRMTHGIWESSCHLWPHLSCLREGLTVQSWLAWKSLCWPDWLPALRNPPAFATIKGICHHTQPPTRSYNRCLAVPKPSVPLSCLWPCGVVLCEQSYLANSPSFCTCTLPLQKPSTGTQC